MINNPKYYKVVINGVDVSSYVYGIPQISKPKNQIIKSGIIKLKKTVSSVLTINDETIGDTITIQRGIVTSTERYLLRGEIISHKDLSSIYELTFADKLYAAQRLEYNYTFDKNVDVEAGVASEIVKTLLTAASVPYSSSSIVSTGTDTRLLLVEYKAQGYIIESLKEIANIYLGQLFYNDDEDLAYFIPRGSIPSSTILTTGVEIRNRPEWNTTGEDLVNNLSVIGGEQLDWNEQQFSGDNSTTEFTLDAKPVDTDIYIDNVKKLRGVNSSDPKDFYVLESQKKIIFSVAPPNTAPNNIVVYYSYNVPIKVTSIDYDSIASYNQHDKTITNTSLTNTDDAELQNTNYIEDNSKVLTSTPLKIIGDNTLFPGQTINIVDNINSKNVNVTVESIRWSYPFIYDEIDVGNIPKTNAEMIQNILENILRLNRKLSSDTDINVQLINNTKLIEVRGSTIIERATADTDVLYWDSETQGTWDDFDWGDDTEETYSELETVYINSEVI